MEATEARTPGRFAPNPIDPDELLYVLGMIYARISAHPDSIGITGIFRLCGHPAIISRRSTLLAAMREMEIVVKVGGNTHGTKWLWNLDKVGPPTLRMAREIIYATARYANRARTETLRRQRARKKAQEKAQDGSRT